MTLLGTFVIIFVVIICGLGILLTIFYTNNHFHYGIMNQILKTDQVQYITPYPVSNIEIATPPAFLNITSPPPDPLPTNATLLDFILIHSGNPENEKAIYIGSYLDPDVGAVVDSTLLICSVILLPDGSFTFNQNAPMSVLLNLNNTSNGIVQYVTNKNYYVLLNSLQQAVVKEKVNIHLPPVTPDTMFMSVEDGIIFRNNIQMGIDSLDKGNLVITGIYGTITFNIASMENGYVNYINNTSFMQSPNKYYSWVFNKSFSSGFQNFFPDISTIRLGEYNIIDSITFSNGIRMDCADDYAIDICGYEALIQMNLLNPNDDLISFINLNNGSVWTYDYENNQKNNLFFDTVPEYLPPATNIQNTVSTIVIKNSRPNTLGLLLEICSFSNPSSCNITQNFISNVSLCIRSVIVQENDNTIPNPYEMARVYFHFNSTMCSSLLEIQQKDSIYTLDYQTLDESFVNVNYNPFENYELNATNGDYMVVQDGLYFSNKCIISLDNANLGNCIISTPTTQIEFNVAAAYRSKMNQPVSSSKECSGSLGSGFNYCPETKVFYCCSSQCEETATCPSNPQLQVCACSQVAVARYISKVSAKTRPFDSWCLYQSGPNVYSNITTLQSPIYTSNYFSTVYNSIPFYNNMFLSAAAGNSLILSGQKAYVVFGGENQIILYSNVRTTLSWILDTNNTIEIKENGTPVATVPPTEDETTAVPEVMFEQNWKPWMKKQINTYQNYVVDGAINGFGAVNTKSNFEINNDSMYVKNVDVNSQLLDSNEFNSKSSLKTTGDILELDAKGDAINGIELYSPNSQPAVVYKEAIQETPYYEKVSLSARRLKGTPTNCNWTIPKSRSIYSTGTNVNSINTGLWSQCPSDTYATGMRFENESQSSNTNEETVSLKCCNLDETEGFPSTCGSPSWGPYQSFSSENTVNKVICPNDSVACGFTCVNNPSSPLFPKGMTFFDKCKLKCCPSFTRRGFPENYSQKKDKCEPSVQRYSIPGRALTGLGFGRSDTGYINDENVTASFSFLDGQQGSCEWTDWKTRSYSTNTEAEQYGAQCPAGKYCAQIEFKHACSENMTTQEEVRLLCCNNNSY